MTLLLEDAPTTILFTDEQEQDANKVVHRFPKDEFDGNLFEGKPMTALCGFVKTDQPKDIIGLDLCKKCEALWMLLNPED